MQSDVSHSHDKVDVSVAVGGRYKHVTANQESRKRTVKCLGSRECLCLTVVSPLLLSKVGSLGVINGTNTGGPDTHVRGTG